MRAVIKNDKIYVCDYTSHEHTALQHALRYRDKALEWRVRKMKKNIYTRNSPLLPAMEAAVNGCLLVEENDQLIFPSGLAHILGDASIDDQRIETGILAAFPWSVKPFDLRLYQEDAVDAMFTTKRGLVNLATGLGKTLVAIHLIRKVGRRTLVLCPNQSIAVNFYNELVSAFGEPRVGFFGDGKKKLRDITVGIVQSVTNHIEMFKKHDLGMLIWDEVHHIAADTFFAIGTELGHVGRAYGLTATDFRNDGKDIMISAGVGPVLIKRDIVWGIQNGWLANPSVIVRAVKTSGRDIPEDKLKNYKAHVLNDKDINIRIIKDIQKCIEQKKSILCLVDEVAHGNALSTALGLPFATGVDKKSNEYIRQLNAGEISGLIATDSKVGEGCDTRNVDVLVLANFSASKGPLMQNLGRGLRKQGTKTDVLVLDYKPLGSTMLSRHADQRIKFYKSIGAKVIVI